ncbi:MAG: SH3 domain-containing protein [Bacteroidales bacterium]|nr:SH3 domain-containing protein [Bacteroidales bacterium]MBR5862753.1 SH3 domain-containing protein [Bacteroidales bacterium]
MEQTGKTNPFKSLWRALKTIMFFWISGKPRNHKFDAWTIGLISFFCIGSTILITDAFTPLNPSFETKKAEVVKTTSMLASRNADSSSEVCVLKRGEKVEILSCATSYYQVETENGERGWVHMTAFGNELVVEELDNDADLKVGTVCSFVKIHPDKKYKIVVKDEGGNTHTLADADVVHTLSFGVPGVKTETSTEKPYIFVTVPWMEKHFKEGAKLDKIMKKYYGNALSIDIRDDGSKMVEFPLHVKEFRTRREYETVKVLFKDDAVVSYQMDDPSKMKFLERWIPFGQRIVASRLFIKLRSHSYVVKPKYDDLEDVIKENQEAKELPKVLRIIVITILLLICWIVLNAHIMFFPALMSLMGRFKKISNDTYESLLFVPVLIYVVLAYLVFLPYWMILVVVFFAVIGFGYKLENWIMYTRCQGCKESHTLETTGWSEPRYYEYDEYILYTSQQAAKSISTKTIKKWSERRHHRVKVQEEYLICRECGSKLTITHETDKTD